MYDLSSQSRFIKHGPCSHCGSKDNVAWYSNGTGYCFGCGYLHVMEQESRARLRAGGVSGVQPTEGDSTDNRKLRSPPDDISTLFPPAVVKWFSLLQLTPADLAARNVVWSQQKEQVIFQFFGEDKHDLILWQARNFREGTAKKDRFFTAGVPNEVVAAYYPREGSRKTAVVVEDCPSAIKISKAGYVGIPAFGAGFSDRKLKRLVSLFDHLVFWLDYDKFKEAQVMVRKAGMLGVHSCMNTTLEDPKYFNVEMIQEMVSKRLR